MGPTSVDICRVAFDSAAYVGVASEPWDVAAVLLVASETGASCPDIARMAGDVYVVAAPQTASELACALGISGSAPDA